jgi:hypothetical protein
VQEAVAAAPPANVNHNHNPILGRTKYLHFLFPNALFPSPGHERRAQVESRICIQPYKATTTCLSGSRYHASHNHHSRTQLRNTWIEGSRTRLSRLPSSMTCRCCPICALQMHSHQDGICVQHPRLGGFGPLPLPGNPRAQAKCNVTHASYCKCSDGRSASRGPSELLECGVRDPANVLCSQFRVTGSVQRGVAFLGGVANLRTCAAPKHFTFGHTDSILLSAFGHGTRMIRAARLPGSPVVYSACLKPAPSGSDSWLSSFPGQGFKIGR